MKFWSVAALGAAMTAGMSGVAMAKQTSCDGAKHDMKAAGHDTKDAAKDTGHAVKTGAKDTGKGVKTGAKDTGHAVKTGAKDTGKGVKTGVKDTGKGLDKAGHAITHPKGDDSTTASH
jgi:hypothetical protein